MKYRLSGTITVSCYCEVEAENAEEAIAKSQELQPAIHFLGSGTFADENWLIEDADGIPTDVRAESVP